MEAIINERKWKECPRCFQEHYGKPELCEQCRKKERYHRTQLNKGLRAIKQEESKKNE